MRNNKRNEKFNVVVNSASEQKFFLFDGHSQIEIRLSPEWLASGFKENPNNNHSKTYFVFGFSFRYFKKHENVKLVQLRFPSNKYYHMERRK